MVGKIADYVVFTIPHNKAGIYCAQHLVIGVIHLTVHVVLFGSRGKDNCVFILNIIVSGLSRFIAVFRLTAVSRAVRVFGVLREFGRSPQQAWQPS